MLLLAGQVVELGQRDLDLLMPAVAALLSGVRTEGGADMVEVTLHDVEHLPPPGGAEVRDGALQKVAAVVELVLVAKIGPAVLQLVADVPEVEVAVVELGSGELFHDVVDLRLDGGIAAVSQRIARGLDPLADVAVPEELRGEARCIAWDAQGRGRVEEQQRLEQAFGLKLAVLARDGAGQYRFQSLPPELALERDLGEIDGRERAHVGCSWLRSARRRSCRAPPGCTATAARRGIARRRSGG